MSIDSDYIKSTVALATDNFLAGFQEGAKSGYDKGFREGFAEAMKQALELSRKAFAGVPDATA